MTRRSRFVTTWLLVGLVACSALSAGCPIGGNTTISVLVPLGLGGAPGAYNPFGIAQAIVNAILGVGSSSSGSGSPNPVPDSSSQISAAIPALAGTNQTTGVTP